MDSEVYCKLVLHGAVSDIKAFEDSFFSQPASFAKHCPIEPPEEGEVADAKEEWKCQQEDEIRTWGCSGDIIVDERGQYADRLCHMCIQG